MSNTILDLQIERPVAGGRMLARHDGVVVLVAGGIPGERVRAEVERKTRDVMWARVVEVVEASAHRRAPFVDPECGGMAYAYIECGEQRRLKAQVIADAFRRVGKITLSADVAVDASPERGYRLRARLHVESDRIGFFREGTHMMCDAGATAQLLPASMTAIQETMASIGEGRDHCAAVVVAENVDATERVLHLEPRPGSTLVPLSGCDRCAGVSGLTTDEKGRVVVLAGSGVVTDSATSLFGDASPVPAATTWSRHATSFFQGNRFLTGSLVGHVIDQALQGPVVDLYAGVGLFAVALAARGAEVVAVEGDRSSGEDLEANAIGWPALTVIRASVEDAAPRLAAGSAASVIVDPPRTGMSPLALGAVVNLGAPRVIYVSCDPPTLARDAAKLVAAGYRIQSIRAFDLFPNTPHIETVVSFDRAERTAS